MKDFKRSQLEDSTIFMNELVGEHGKGVHKSIFVQTVISSDDHHLILFIVKNHTEIVQITNDLDLAIDTYNRS